MGEEKGFRKISDEEYWEILKVFDPWTSTYQQINDEELKTILEQHAKWLEAEGKEGEQANLRLADLSNRDLKEAKLGKAKLEITKLVGANLEKANLSSADLSIANLSSANLSGVNLSFAQLSAANLSSAQLREANLTSAKIYEANLSYADLVGANLSNAMLIEANLSSAVLIEANLSSADLPCANLSSAQLFLANFSSANLYKANLRGCDLSFSNLRGADLARAVLAETTLSYAKIRAVPRPDKGRNEKSQKEEQEKQKKQGEGSKQPELKESAQKNKNKMPLPARNLHARQLAGADLANAGLPDHVWQGFRDGLVNVAEATKKVDKLFVGLLVGCAYFALVLALLNPGSSVKLPIINTLIPQDVFFWAAPLGVLLVYLYFQLNLQRLWERLAELPAVFEDGTPLDKKAAPWLPVGYARAHFRLLREADDKPPLSWAQTLVIQLLVWWSAPAALVAIWLRCVHDSPTFAVCLVQVVATMLVVGAALVFLGLARRTLRLEYSGPQLWVSGTPPWNTEGKRKKASKSFLKNVRKHWWRILIVTAVGAAMAWYSWHVISNVPLC